MVKKIVLIGSILAIWVIPLSIKGKSIYSKSAIVTGVKDKTYTGKAITQTIKVKYNGKTLKKGRDYTVTYKENKAVGYAYLEIKGKGNYVGVLREWFNILPKTTTLRSVKSLKKGQMTVNWNNTKGDTTKYQIVYSTNSKFTKNVKSVYVSANSASKIIKGLKSKTTYYVKVRKVKTLSGYYGGEKMYGKYSAVKKVKVK